MTSKKTEYNVETLQEMQSASWAARSGFSKAEIEYRSKLQKEMIELESPIKHEKPPKKTVAYHFEQAAKSKSSELDNRNTNCTIL